MTATVTRDATPDTRPSTTEVAVTGAPAAQAASLGTPRPGGPAPGASAPRPLLPGARGPLSEALLAVLTGAAAALPESVGTPDPYGEDLQLALHLAYELHYRPLRGVDPDLEWDPEVLRFRRLLEREFLAALRADVAGGDDVDAVLEPLLVEPVDGTGASWHLARVGDRAQLREYVVQRSIYHLKEGDPQSWAVPRLEGQAKASLVTVQHDEYGAGRVERMHAQLFVEMMRELELDPTYGRYVDIAPAVTLAPVNFMSMAGLHRTLLGAAVGQFAMIEVTSSPGSRRMSSAFERLYDGNAGRRFYDEHVEADAVHEQLMRRGLLQDLLQREPHLAADVVLGIQAGLLLEDRFGGHLLARWTAGESSLRAPLSA